MSTDPTTYGPENLKSLRLTAGLSRREFIEQMRETTGLELHQTSLQRLESGEQTMKASEAVAIADFFKVSLDQLLREPADQVAAEIRRKAQDLKRKAWEVTEVVRGADRAAVELAQRLDEDDVPPAVQSAVVRDAHDALDRYKPFTLQMIGATMKYWPKDDPGADTMYLPVDIEAGDDQG
ncbi:helix-turn-helix domain-containing protein [Corynebacterium variabile]|uniref:HTH cro/C1-type domain-containing protein n=1 Tax=Corynebacterium variabile TaxID=1727 RepID=A0A4Y4C448_9CORY|nr:helix-turn-helix transcriptional regulator [Corynebacterium variabile]GEC85890.1 hypothetical protein CVA01_12040 [Corynebacterium variabile]